MAKDAAWIPTAGFHSGRGGGGGNKHFHVERNENWPTRCHCCSKETQQPGDFSGHNLRVGAENWLQWGSTNRNSGYSSSLSQILHMPTPLKRNPTAPPTQMPPVAPSFWHLFPACCPAASCQIPMLDGIRFYHCSAGGAGKVKAAAPSCFQTPLPAASGNLREVQRGKPKGNKSTADHSTQQWPWAS